jgi:hypothetical protein
MCSTTLVDSVLTIVYWSKFARHHCLLTAVPSYQSSSFVVYYFPIIPKGFGFEAQKMNLVSLTAFQNSKLMFGANI